MRVLGLDVGSKTIGVAVSDPFNIIAQGITTIAWDEKKIHSADEQLQEIMKEYPIEKAVIGLPINTNGTIGERGEASKRFASYFEETHNIPVILWDERFSTIAANRTLLEADVSRTKRKKVIDKIAAVMILQTYLDSIKKED